MAILRIVRVAPFVLACGQRDAIAIVVLIGIVRSLIFAAVMRGVTLALGVVSVVRKARRVVRAIAVRIVMVGAIARRRHVGVARRGVRFVGVILIW